jgi:hypothetical protein
MKASAISILGVLDGCEILVSTDVDVLAKLPAAYPRARDSPEHSA